MRMPNIFTTPTFLVIDLFCGAGGVSTGFTMAKGIALVIACVNHDHTAILSHKVNHPDTEHFEEDIRVLDVAPLVALLKKFKRMYPKAKTILWGSLECQSHSKARGGMAKNADSRTLDDVFVERYVKVLDVDYVMVENVVEFEVHGPTRIKIENIWHNDHGCEVWDLCIMKDKHGDTIYGHEVIPERKGEYFKLFNENICAEGYQKEWTTMNAADYGAFTSRDRLFGIFKRPGLPNAWPTKTHDKTGANGLLRWNAVKEKIDFSDEGYSIFHRSHNKNIPKRHRKEISDNSFDRYYEGCVKHIAGGWEAFEKHVQTYFPEMAHIHCRAQRKGKNRKETPKPEAAFIGKFYSGKPESRSSSINEPLGTIPTENRFALIQGSFLGTYHGNGHNTHNVDGAAPAIPCNDSLYVINTNFIDKQYNGSFGSSSMEDPLGTITPVDKNKLITGKQIEQLDLGFGTPRLTGDTTSGNDDIPKTARRWPHLINPSYGGHTHSILDACPTIVARQDKAPLCLCMVLTKDGYCMRIFDTDSPAVVKLKQFMVMYCIVDIKMRMLKVSELMKIQGFPDGYVLAGSQEEQKKHIGNSVEPNQVTCWATALHHEILKMAA